MGGLRGPARHDGRQGWTDWQGGQVVAVVVTAHLAESRDRSSSSFAYAV
jgi:hypothetical protein